MGSQSWVQVKGINGVTYPRCFGEQGILRAVEFDIMEMRSVVLNVEGIVITGRLYLPGDGAGYPAVCICHGIPSGKPPDPGDGGYPMLAERISREGFAVFIFNFRGTGDSGGNLDMPGWAGDLKAVIDYLLSLPEVGYLTLIGFSAGAAVSVYVASQDSRIAGVIACACPAEFLSLTEADEAQTMIDKFRNIGAIRDANFPRDIEAWMDGFRLVRPIKYVAGIAPRPLLLVHGDADETVDVRHAHRLYDKAGEPRQIVILENAGHRLRHDDRAVSAILDWLRSQCKNCFI